MEVTTCITCGSVLVGTNYVAFPCPECGEEIYRCKRCRRLANTYRCKKCGFTGP
ncbi:MAG: zinc finger domain-containing protein [Archaeoglobales archaeon]|nr:zinc finger domain-containing protein [Archaeoglobales archaeon]